jgi:hypothetical protein
MAKVAVPVKFAMRFISLTPDFSQVIGMIPNGLGLENR